MLLATCYIVKSDIDEAVLLVRSLTSIYKYVDKIFITATYKDDIKETEVIRNITKPFNVEFSTFKWTNNFSEARNFNFSQVPKKYEWISWFDADDVIRGAKYFKEDIRIAEKNDWDAISAWYLYDFDEYKNCTVKHSKTRIVRNDGGVEWAGALHEDFKKNRDIQTGFTKDFQVIHLFDDSSREEKSKRNYDICKLEVKRIPEDPRTWWNLGAAAMEIGKWKEAITALKKLVKDSEAPEEIFIAYTRIGESYRILGKSSKAKYFAYRAMLVRPQYPDAYLLMGNIFHQEEDWAKAKEFFVIGLAKPKPVKNIIYFNPRDYDFNPAFKLGHTYAMLDRFDDALNLISNVCLKMYPEHPKAKAFAKFLKGEIKLKKRVIKLSKKLKRITDKDVLKKELDNLEPKIRSHPAIVNVYNTHFIKKKTTGREIDIYCGKTDFVWNPDTARVSGVSGSEEAVIHISELLSKKGYDVTVYANMGEEPKKYNDVQWKPFWEFNYKDAHDTLIAWRHPVLFNREINAKLKIVWLHDILPKEEFTEKRLKNIDYVFCLTPWHLALYPNIPDKKKILFPNGINVDEFTSDIKRVKNRFIWTSSYDRGLDCLLGMWPKIKSELKDASLDIYYGWNNYDMLYKDNPQRLAWKKDLVKVIDKLEKLGVKEHGRIPLKDIAKKYQEAEIWAYPTEWVETFCITAIKAQLAGVVPVTTNLAGLQTTAVYGEKVKVDDIYSNEEAQKEFIAKVIKVAKNRDDYQIDSMKKWAATHTWDAVADIVDRLII